MCVCVFTVLCFIFCCKHFNCTIKRHFGNGSPFSTKCQRCPTLTKHLTRKKQQRKTKTNTTKRKQKKQPQIFKNKPICKLMQQLPLVPAPPPPPAPYNMLWPPQPAWPIPIARYGLCQSFPRSFGAAAAAAAAARRECCPVGSQCDAITRRDAVSILIRQRFRLINMRRRSPRNCLTCVH